MKNNNTETHKKPERINVKDYECEEDYDDSGNKLIKEDAVE